MTPDVHQLPPRPTPGDGGTVGLRLWHEGVCCLVEFGNHVSSPSRKTHGGATMPGWYDTS